MGQRKPTKRTPTKKHRAEQIDISQLTTEQAAELLKRLMGESV